MRKVPFLIVLVCAIVVFPDYSNARETSDGPEKTEPNKQPEKKEKVEKPKKEKGEKPKIDWDKRKQGSGGGVRG